MLDLRVIYVTHVTYVIIYVTCVTYMICYKYDPTNVCPNKLLNAIKALSHIHVSAAYRSRIYENLYTPRSEEYFVQATYVPRTCDVPATFLWCISDVSVFVWNFTFVCMAYQGVCATYV